MIYKEKKTTLQKRIKMQKNNQGIYGICQHNTGSSSGLLLLYRQNDKHEVMRRGQSAGQENRAGKRNVPAGAEVG